MKISKGKPVRQVFPELVHHHQKTVSDRRGPKVTWKQWWILPVLAGSEGDRAIWTYRILRTSRIALAPTHELGNLRQDAAEGAVGQVANPFRDPTLPSWKKHLTRVAIGAMMEGNRPLADRDQIVVSSARSLLARHRPLSSTGTRRQRSICFGGIEKAWWV